MVFKSAFPTKSILVFVLMIAVIVTAIVSTSGIFFVFILFPLLPRILAAFFTTYTITQNAIVVKEFLKREYAIPFAAIDDISRHSIGTLMQIMGAYGEEGFLITYHHNEQLLICPNNLDLFEETLRNVTRD